MQSELLSVPKHWCEAFPEASSKICFRCSERYWRGAGRIAIVEEESLPINDANSLIFTVLPFSISDTEILSSVLCLEEDYLFPLPEIEFFEPVLILTSLCLLESLVIAKEISVCPWLVSVPVWTIPSKEYRPGIWSGVHLIVWELQSRFSYVLWKPLVWTQSKTKAKKLINLFVPLKANIFLWFCMERNWKVGIFQV